MERLSSLLLRLENELISHPLTIGELFEILGSRGHSLFIFFLTIPFLLPIPLPGFSMLMGVVFAIVGARFFCGLNPWIPQSIASKKIPQSSFHKMFRGARWVAKKMEPLIRPRWEFIFQWKGIKKWEGFLITCAGIFLALPLPPGTNFPPALVLITISLANLEKDGILVLVSSVCFFLNLLFFGALFFYGAEGIRYFLT